MLKKPAALSFTVALALGGVVALLWLLSGSQVALAQSGTGVIRVATTGSDTPGCGGVASPCQTVQYAVDQAQAGVDEIRVAAGLYTGVSARPAPAGYPNPPASGLVTQVVYINKTVTIRGGYTTAFTDPPDPETNQATLDAQGGGRVLLISGDISPTIEGLRITGGDATGLGGGLLGDGGGGLYLHHSDATLSGNTIHANTADQGGGLWLESSDATLSGNAVTSNTAATDGGGLYLWYSNATLSANRIISNVANTTGGGLYLMWSAATLTNNVVADNRANTRGSGLYIYGFPPRLLHTTVARNGSTGSGGDGTGIYVSSIGTVALTNTILVSHSVGITVAAGSTATLESTLWQGNATPWSGNVNRNNDYSGNPGFGADGYHLMEGSAAIDKGVDAGVTTDIDGEPRDATPDLGADEWVTSREKVYLPLILQGD